MSPAHRGRLLLILLALAAVLLLLRLALRQTPPEEAAYVSRRAATLWSHWGQVRQPVAELRFGVRVAVLDRRDGLARARTDAGQEGWLGENQLMPAEMWERARALTEETRAMPVQARARTKTAANLRAAPGRESPVIFFLRAGSAAEIFRRAAAERPAADGAAARREDWLLIRAHPDEAGEIAGWVYGRLLEPELPAPLAARAGPIRFLAWFELNPAPDPARGPQPQYLAVGATGPEGGVCDFTLLRVFTWNAGRARYETAYLESALCGLLPVLVSAEDDRPTFRFRTLGAAGETERAYQLRHTIVRRLQQ